MSFQNIWNQIRTVITEEIQYFSMSLEQQAIFLENKKRLRFARKKYIQLRNLEKVIELSRSLRDFRFIVQYYIRQEQPEQAIQAAELYEIYDLGAPLCEKQGNLIKAANMYIHIDPVKAAALYKQEGLTEKAGQAYLQAKQYIRAIDCFDQLTDPQKKKRGYASIEEQADLLSNQKNYGQAVKLYIRIHALGKALEAAKKMNDTSMESFIYEQLIQEARDQGDYWKAAGYYEQFDPQKAIPLYIQLEEIRKAAHLLTAQHKLEEAIFLYVKYHYMEDAWALAKEHHLLPLLIPYYQETQDFEKLTDLFEQTQDYEKAVLYFQSQKAYEQAIAFAKKLHSPKKTAVYLEQMGANELAAHYYLQADDISACKSCLSKAGFSGEQIQTYLQVKNYGSS